MLNYSVAELRYDKNGNKKYLYTGSRQYFNASANYAVGHDKLKDQGTIVIGDANNTTNDFVPLSVKYIKIKVTCDGLEELVTIKQYPLEYIQGIAGWYSTKSIDGWIDWQTDQASHDTKKKSSDNNFHAKVKIGTKIYEYNDYYSYYYGYYAEYDQDATSGRDNNQMYVVQITSTNQTSSDYKIGHVTNINPNTKLSEENVVSPAFMLASQLGTVSTFSKGVNASNHCDKYVEVRTDGKKYTGWRLPTAAEIGVITKYQYDSKQDVMSEVLRGRQYWALDGSKVTANKNGSGSGYVRCVRDLKPDEVKELENKNE